MATATLPLSSTLASLTGLASVTYAWESTRNPATPRDGNARSSLVRALTLALLATAEGREALDALTAGPDALRTVHDAILYADSRQWKATAENREALDQHLAKPSEVAWPVCTPQVAKYAHRALATYATQEARKASKVAPIATRPTAHKGFPTLATVQAHQTQEGTKVEGRTSDPAWKGRKVA